MNKQVSDLDEFVLRECQEYPHGFPGEPCDVTFEDVIGERGRPEVVVTFTLLRPSYRERLENGDCDEDGPA